MNADVNLEIAGNPPRWRCPACGDRHGQMPDGTPVVGAFTVVPAGGPVRRICWRCYWDWVAANVPQMMPDADSATLEPTGTG